MITAEIARLYTKGFDEVLGYKGLRDCTMANFHRLEDGQTTIGEYLALLTDEELLSAYDRQCCQRYR
jgi:hypothetical protein